MGKVSKIEYVKRRDWGVTGTEERPRVKEVCRLTFTGKITRKREVEGQR